MTDVVKRLISAFSAVAYAEICRGWSNIAQEAKTVEVEANCFFLLIFSTNFKKFVLVMNE